MRRRREVRGMIGMGLGSGGEEEPWRLVVSDCVSVTLSFYFFPGYFGDVGNVKRIFEKIQNQ